MRLFIKKLKLLSEIYMKEKAMSPWTTHDRLQMAEKT